MQGGSSRIWVLDNFGIEGNFYHAGIGYERGSKKWDGTLAAATGKILIAPVVKNNSRFYLGVEAGYGKASATDSDEELNVTVVSPLLGTEYFFSEMPELGFDWEGGYRYNIYDISGVSLSLRGISAAIGAHLNEMADTGGIKAGSAGVAGGARFMHYVTDYIAVGGEIGYFVSGKSSKWTDSYGSTYTWQSKDILAMNIVKFTLTPQSPVRLSLLGGVGIKSLLQNWQFF